MTKTALVTGFATNIGKRISEKFLRNGYSLIGVYHPRTVIEAQLMKKNFPVIDILEADFCQERDLVSLITRLKHRTLDVIVNNAGMLNLSETGTVINEFFDFNIKSFEDVMKCNFYAPLRICIELKERINEGGSIINIGSGGGMRASYATLSYSSSKAALINLSASLSNNFYPYNKIRVNCVSPGWVTPDSVGGMCSDLNSPGGKAALLTAMGRNATTSEIADVVYFLSTEEAAFINGANIVVDGGWLNHNVIYYEEATGLNLLKM